MLGAWRYGIPLRVFPEDGRLNRRIVLGVPSVSGPQKRDNGTWNYESTASIFLLGAYCDKYRKVMIPFKIFCRSGLVVLLGLCFLWLVCISFGLKSSSVLNGLPDFFPCFISFSPGCLSTLAVRKRLSPSAQRGLVRHISVANMKTVTLFVLLAASVASVFAAPIPSSGKEAPMILMSP